MIITKTFTLYCAECSREPRLAPEQSQVRDVLKADSMRGERAYIVRSCAHVSVLETFDIENDAADYDAAQ